MPRPDVIFWIAPYKIIFTLGGSCVHVFGIMMLYFLGRAGITTSFDPPSPEHTLLNYSFPRYRRTCFSPYHCLNQFPVQRLIFFDVFRC